MNSLWKNNNYELVITQDGSPSLCWNQQEVMHHRAGALAETELIYGEVIKSILDKGGQSFISVGLGLGYNELVIAREILNKNSSNLADKNYFIFSFEIDQFLQDQFIDFIKTRNMTSIYAQICNQMKLSDLNICRICDFLYSLYLEKRFVFPGALGTNTQITIQAEGILYDAFSSKTNPELWSEDFLNNFIQKYSANNCIFSTYACTGSLKRALKKQGFTVTIRPGFNGKRNSTLAIKGY